MKDIKKSISIILSVVMLLGIIASASMTAFAGEIRWGDYYCRYDYYSNDGTDQTISDYIEGNWCDDGEIKTPKFRTVCPFEAPAGKRFKCWANKPEAATAYRFPSGKTLGYGLLFDSQTDSYGSTYYEYGSFYAIWENIGNPVCIVAIIGGERYLPEYPPVICNKYGTLEEPKDINSEEDIIGWYTNRTAVEAGYDSEKGEMSYEYEYDEKDRYDFSSPVTTDFTLYARTVQKGEVVINPHGTVGSTKWEYDITTSTFTVSGSGSFNFDDDANEYLCEAKNFVVEDGVTAIGDNILLNADKLEAVEIADSVKSIGTDCFQNCPKLKSVTLGEGLESIGSGSFSELPLVSEIKIPDSVKTISDGAFLSNSDDFKLNSNEGSAAQTYAEANGIKFEAIEETEPQPTTSPVTTDPQATTEPQTTTEPVETTAPATTEPQTTTEPAETTAPATTEPQATTAPEPQKTTAPAVTAKKANPVKVTVKTKTVKLKNLKKKNQTVKAITVKNAKGKVTYKLTSVPKKIKKLTKISSKGVITINKWKKAKKGTYKFKVKITAAGNADYNKKSVTKKVTVKIK